MKWAVSMLVLTYYVAIARVLAVSVADYAVQVSATAQGNPAKITLSWPADPVATNYVLFRKLRDETSWGAGSVLGPNATTWTDTNVNLGGAYEYRVSKGAPGYVGVGYIYSGIEVPLLESRGKIILLVESGCAASLGAELAQLQQDLVGDGWAVLRHDVARTAAVTEVKALIAAHYNADPANVDSVFLLGHVPVPYSGDLAPDGHSNHQGSWPADVYYGDVNGTWTDSAVNTVVASDPRNWNVAGDGKFDQTSLPSDVELQVGRVDLANLPAFSQNETELLRQYLNKDHNFRHKLITADPRGLIDDNFGISNGEYFAVNGWRNFAPFFGAAGTFSNSNWFDTLSSSSYLWAYGCGAGTYTGASGVGGTTDFAASDPKVVFTMLYGSYFGDWDSQNSFLRAPLATTNYTLICVWAGRPNWQFHHMALGEPIGFSTRLSQNNSLTYEPGSSWRYVHIALMGDPTLRMQIVAPPAALVVVTNGAGGVDLSWSSSPDPVLGYHVYRAATVAGPFTRLNNTLISGTNFTDAVVATNVYMVRAVKLEVNSSGSYYNASQGVFQDLAGSFSRPALRIDRVFNGVSLSWPAKSPAYHLEATTAFSPTNWLSISNAVQTSNGFNTVVVGLSGSNQFFRLTRP